jgi:predicted Zn-dependent protease
LPSLDALLKLIDGPRDNALLRHSIGLVHLEAGRPAEAVPCFRAAVDKDPRFSAGWKMLGKALAEAGDAEGARGAYERGIAVADERGDVQAAKEMKVFLRRLEPR